MEMSGRAYSLLEIKELDEDARIIRGMATTPTPDRTADIVLPEGAVFKLPLPLLWQHDPSRPIGFVTEAKVTKKGIEIVAEIVKGVTPWIDEAWALIKAKLVRGLSIGFRGLDTEQIPNSWGVIFQKWEWLELSAVTIPAQAEANITSIKQFDVGAPAAPGTRATNGDVPPGASGKSTKPVNLRPKEAKTMSKTIQEQIAALEAKRAANAARMAEIMQKSTDEGRTTDAAEQEEFDTLEAETAPIEADLKRFRALETAQTASARPVAAANHPEGHIRTVEDGAAVRGGQPIQVKRNIEKGIIFTRLIGAKYLAYKHHMPAVDVARSKFGDTPEVESILKAAVAAGTTTDTTWAGPLVELQNATGEFVELLRPATIIGRIPGLRRVPFNIKVPRGTQDPTSYWVGQASVKPVSAMGFDSIELEFNKVAGIVVQTEELMRFSNPASEMLIRDGLVASVAYLTDRDFLDPSKAVETGVSPASVTNGVTPVTSSGTTADALRADLGSLIQEYLEANMSVAGLVLVMTSVQAMRLSLMRNALDQVEFPGIGPMGGTLGGIPVITSENIVATASSPADGYPIIAINAPEVYLADDGGVDIDISREASLQMDSAPDSPNTASTVLVSLWQRNMVAMKAERFITWKKRRDGAVQFIQGAKYA